MVIVVLGLPGSGKSYFAERFAREIHAEYFNSDRIRKDMFPERTYSDSEKEMVYKVLLEKLQEAIEKEKDVVLDATFYKKKIREPFITKGEGKIRFIEVWAEDKIIQERLKKNRPFSEADYKVYELLKQQWEPLEVPHLSLQSTNNNIEVMLKKALNYINDEKRTS